MAAGEDEAKPVVRHGSDLHRRVWIVAAGREHGHLAEQFPSARLAAQAGGRRVELRYHGPAHTRGDQIVWLPDERILFAGDLVENRFFPILPDADTQGSLWIALLERLEALRPAVVVPGHGEVGDSGLIVEVRQYLEDVRSRVRELAGEGLALDAIKATLAPELITRYSTWENPVWVDFAIENFHGELDG